MGGLSSQAASLEMGRWSSNFALDKNLLTAQNLITSAFSAWKGAVWRCGN